MPTRRKVRIALLALMATMLCFIPSPAVPDTHENLRARVKNG